jgi:SAM-dependent methyltransferase
VYATIAEELGAKRVLDVGCGTGTFAMLLAGRGFEVTGVDPALASLDVARGKPGVDRVRWIHGDATSLPPARAGRPCDDDRERGSGDRRARGLGGDAARDPRRASSRGYLVFETRDPAYRAWEAWNREASYAVTEIDGVDAVTSWYDLTEVNGPLVSFRSTTVFESDGVHDVTVRGEIRGAPDRPGRELVFFARRAEIRQAL